MHAGQQRSDGTPFILHPLEVASLLRDDGAPEHLIAAGVLHDVLEKTDATESDLQERFGPRITGLVVAVSDDPTITSYARRKAALRAQAAAAGTEALRLFAADKVSKVGELRREASAGAEAHAAAGGSRGLRNRRVKHYGRCVEMLEDCLPESPLVRTLRQEFDALLRDWSELASAH
jgi:hypothetical protein